MSRAGGSEVLFDGFESEEQFVPAAEARFDREFFVSEVSSDGGERAGVVLENDAKGVLVV